MGLSLPEWGITTGAGYHTAGNSIFGSGGSGSGNFGSSGPTLLASYGGGWYGKTTNVAFGGFINSGGGGAGKNSGGAYAGGSGVVIVRYRKELVGL
jgi:hypothetical protein